MSILQIRVDQDIKDKVTDIVNQSKIDISIAVRLFLLMVIKEKRIPFDINSNNEYELYRDNIAYLLDCIDYNEDAPMSFQDIEKEIKASRQRKRTKK